MSVLIDFSIFPVDKGENLSSYVARAVKIIRFSEQAQVPWLPRVNDLKDQAGEMRAQGLSGRGTGGHLRILDEHYKIMGWDRTGKHRKEQCNSSAPLPPGGEGIFVD